LECGDLSPLSEFSDGGDLLPLECPHLGVDPLRRKSKSLKAATSRRTP
jgi:hypothetical protein